MSSRSMFVLAVTRLTWARTSWQQSDKQLQRARTPPPQGRYQPSHSGRGAQATHEEKAKIVCVYTSLLQGSPIAVSRSSAARTVTGLLSLGAAWDCCLVPLSSISASCDRTTDCHCILTTRVATRSRAVGVEKGFCARLPEQESQNHGRTARAWERWHSVIAVPPDTAEVLLRR